MPRAFRREEADAWLAGLWVGLDGWAALAFKVGERRWERTYRWPADRTDLLLDVAAAGNASVWYAPNLRAAPERRKVTPAVGRMVWADLDRPDAELHGLRAGLVSSGRPGHRHVYVPLDRPLPGAEVELLNRRLADYLKADHKWSSESILSLPGTWNRKPGAGPVTIEVPLTGLVPYTSVELSNLLPPPAAHTLPAVSEVAPVVTEHRERAIPKHIRAWRDGERTCGKTPSEDRLVMFVNAVEWGLTDAQVMQLAREHATSANNDGDRLGQDALRFLERERPRHPHVGLPCDGAGCPNAPLWMRSRRAQG